jgi:hypothetical protein
VHILLGLLVLGVLGFLIYRASRASPAGDVPLQASSEVAAEAARLDIAFVSNGKLFYREPGAALSQVQSNHVQEALDRRERSKRRHGWKQNTSFGVSANGGMRRFDAADTPIAVTSATFDEVSGRLLYFLKDETVGGLFACPPGRAEEQRILLKEKLHLEDLSLSPDGQMLSASSLQDDGVANLVLLKRDGSALREVTAGDTCDTAPAWIPGVENRLLFQSAGLARDEGGYVVAQGNATIQMLNMESGSVAAVLEDAAYDFIQPRVCLQGNLHYIRRPYEAPRYGADSFLIDTLLFPFRLLRALFHWLNFFSMMYSRKPLTSASGPAVSADIKNIMLQGRRIDAEKNLRKERLIHGVPSLVPRSWELVCRTPEGAERVLATNVASYDISARGRIVYSNGRGVFMLGDDGKSALALKSDFIAQVFAAQMPARAAD